MPWATSASIGFGCNTPCVEVRDDRTGAYLVLDAGSGLVGLSGTFTGEPRSTPVLLSHYHWDHTQGLPFFAPLYMPGWTPAIYAPELPDLPNDWVHTMFGPPNFPVPFAALPEPSGHDAARGVSPGDWRVHGLRSAAHASRRGVRLPHSRADRRLCYVTDHEFGNAGNVDAQLAAFCRNCAALIADAHFTPEELPRSKRAGDTAAGARWPSSRPRAAPERVAVPSQTGADRRRDQSRSRRRPGRCSPRPALPAKGWRSKSEGAARPIKQVRGAESHRRCGRGCGRRRRWCWRWRRSFARRLRRGVDPLQSVEFRTYDWRLTQHRAAGHARARTSRSSRSTRRRCAACSPTPGAGRGRAPCTRC